MPTYKQTTILGIDPGYATTGWGVIKKDAKQIKMVAFGTIKTEAKEKFDQRLKKLSQELNKIIKKYNPNILSIEDLFFANNKKTAIKVGEARGVVLLTAVNNNLPIYNFTPLQVKQATTSYGQAGKEQVQKMIKLLLKLKSAPQPDDAADALAIAYCCAQSTNINYDSSH